MDGAVAHGRHQINLKLEKIKKASVKVFFSTGDIVQEKTGVFDCRRLTLPSVVNT